MDDQEKIPESKEAKAKKQAASFMLVEIGIEFAVIIALPLIAFIYGGRWLDQRYGTKLFVVAGILLALGLSSYLIFKKIKEVKDLLK